MTAQEVPPSRDDEDSEDQGDQGERGSRLRRRWRTRRMSSDNPVINLRAGEAPADLPSAEFVRGYEVVDRESRVDEISDDELRKWVGGPPSTTVVFP